jgi:hypothetical protein
LSDKRLDAEFVLIFRTPDKVVKALEFAFNRPVGKMTPTYTNLRRVV